MTRSGSDIEKRIYLDFNASSPLVPEVVEAMQPFLAEDYGNPSCDHWAGTSARSAVERARSQVAGLLGCSPEEIVLTSGGSESNNQALKGAFFASRHKGEHIVASAVEHPAVLKPLEFLERLGAKVTLVPVDRQGRVDPESVRRALTPRTILVSVMHANNEVGTVQPISEISAIARRAGALMHTDAAQTVGKIPTRVDDLGVDLLSVAGHKLHGPKGIGALYVRRGTKIEPLVHGAGHEQGRRAGTENALLAVGLGAACEVAARWLGMPTLRALRDRFEQELKALLGDTISVNGAETERLPNTASVNFVGQVGADVLARLAGVAASTGSACHAGSVEISPVLATMGVAPREAMGAVRFSLGRTTTWEDLQAVLAMLGERGSVHGNALEEHWERIHRARTEAASACQQRRSSTSVDLILGAGVGRDARVIDIGGGASRLADALLDRGFERVTVLDIASTALERAKRRTGARAGMVTWVAADVTTWAPRSSFDVWHDRAVFHFLVRKEDRQAYRAAMKAALKIGAQAVIGTIAAGGPDRCSGLPVIRYEPASLASELGPDFRLVESVHEDHLTRAGTTQRFQFSRFLRV